MLLSRKWIGVVLNGPEPGRESHQELVALAFKLAPSVSTDHLFKELDGQNEEHGDLMELHAFKKCWNADLSIRLVEWMTPKTLNAKALRYCLVHLSVCDPAVALVQIRIRLLPAPVVTPETIPIIAETVDTGLAYLPHETWDCALAARPGK